VDCNAVPQLFARMNGREETPPNLSPGLGQAKVYIDQANRTISVCWEVHDLVAPISAAHIHQAPFGVAGPIVLPFTVPNPHGDFFTTVNTNVDPALIQQLLANPNGFYINVHTQSPTNPSVGFPDGEIRGQLNPGGPFPAPSSTASATLVPGTATSTPVATSTVTSTATAVPTSTTTLTSTVTATSTVTPTVTLTLTSTGCNPFSGCGGNTATPTLTPLLTFTATRTPNVTTTPCNSFTGCP